MCIRDRESYTEGELKEEEFNQAVEEFQLKQAAEEKEIIKDSSMLSKGLKTLAYGALVVTLILAGNTLLGSPDEGVYLSNRDIFYKIGFACTLIYFVAAYWAMRRGKSLNVK